MCVVHLVLDKSDYIILMSSLILQGTLKMDISPCPDLVKKTLSPDLARLHPYPDDKGRPTKEILEFPSREVYVPFTTYRFV